MFRVPLEKPCPDFDDLEKVIKGERESKRVHLVELMVDPEIMEYIIRNYLHGTMDRQVMEYMQSSYARKGLTLASKDVKERCQQQSIDFYWRMGYDSIKVSAEYRNLPDFKRRIAPDTARLSRSQRDWVEEKEGIINSWDDFERIDWNNIQPDLTLLHLARKNLPKGMKILVGTPLFEIILERFMGYENLFVLSYDEPQLVEAIFEQWGKKVHEFYQRTVKFSEVGGIFHNDDLGYKAGTMMNPDFLRKNVFPWFKRYAFLSHREEKMFWLHSCGNLSKVMEDLIGYVGIDALHSFEDSSCSVVDYKRRYGDRIALLGGVDMDKLTRMSEPQFRGYVRRILKECMPTRYALGSGNTIANYVSVENYLTMLDEGLRWNGQ